VVNDCSRGALHRAYEYWKPGLALGNDRAGIRTVDTVGAIKRFGNNWREGGLLLDQIHLVGDLAQSVLDHCERDRVGCRCGSGEVLHLRLDRNQQISEFVDLDPGLRIDRHGRVELFNDGRPLELHARS